jgi:arylsulfatase A-like enzyme
VVAQSRCSLGFVVALLNRMKQAGIYEDSLIVLMADHGGHIHPDRYRSGAFITGNIEYDLRPDFLGLATPLLAVKPPGATHPFTTSTALTSMTDVAATVAALAGLGGNFPGTSIWDPAHGAPGPRRFFGYEWSRMNPVHKYIAGMEEYLVTGSAYEARSWNKGASLPPPDEP